MPLIALQLFASYHYSRDNITIKFITRLLINTREVIAKNNSVMSKLMIFSATTSLVCFWDEQMLHGEHNRTAVIFSIDEKIVNW